jgi:large subunit ribosomal protein L6
MSKIGRRPIALDGVSVETHDKFVTIKGPKGSFKHELPAALRVVKKDSSLSLELVGEKTRHNSMLWGLHRALIANEIQGVSKGFRVDLQIVGLGFKAQMAGKKVTFTLGYSHKIDYEIPENVVIEIDKTGQLITVGSNDKFLVGSVCDSIRSMRPPEPYKGTGIMRQGEVIVRKAGKTKSAA